MAATLDDILAQDSANASSLAAALDGITSRLTTIIWRLSGLRAPAVTAAAATPVPAPAGGTGPGPSAIPGATPTPTTPAPAAGGTRQFEAFATSVAKLSVVFLAAERALTGFGSALVGFVQHVRPDVVIRWQYAADSLSATVGKILVPVLERVTLLVRTLAGAINSLSPVAMQFLAGLTTGAAAGAALVAVVAGIKALAVVAGPLTLVLGSLAGAVAGVAASTASGRELAAAFAGVLQVLGRVFESMAAAVVPAAAGVLVPALQSLAKILGSVADVVSRLAAGLVESGAAARVLVGALALLAARQYLLAVSTYGAIFPVAALGLSITGLGAAAKFALKAFAIGIVLVPVLQALAPLMDLFGRAVERVAEKVRKALEWIGLSSPEGDRYLATRREGVAPVRRAQVGGIEAFATRAATMAYSGSSDDIPAESLDRLTSIDATLKVIKSITDRWAAMPRTMDPETRRRRESGRPVDAGTPDTFLGDAIGRMRALFGTVGGRP